jgi:hypothetical protein
MKSGSLNLLEPSGPLQSCNGTALPLCFMKSGVLNLLEPSGPHRACYGTALPLPFILGINVEPFILFFFFFLQLKSDPFHPIVGFYISHIFTHTHTHPVGLPSSQGSLNVQHKTSSRGEHPYCQRDSNPRSTNPAASDLHHRPHVDQDRKQMLHAKVVLKSFITYD